MSRKPIENQRSVLAQAIRERKVITLMYHGRFRVLCPHFLGRTGNAEKCLFLQIGGDSESGLFENDEDNWRCMNLDSLHDIRIADAPEWRSARNANRWKQKCIEKVDVSFEP